MRLIRVPIMNYRLQQRVTRDLLAPRRAVRTTI
jgi:hypothetical protein